MLMMSERRVLMSWRKKDRENSADSENIDNIADIADRSDIADIENVENVEREDLSESEDLSDNSNLSENNNLSENKDSSEHKALGQHRDNSPETESQRKRHLHNIGIVFLSSISAIILIVVSLILATMQIYPNVVDSGVRSSTSVTQQVGATSLKMVCPARLSVSESSDYGDKEYRESDGNSTSMSRFAAFGNVYRATVRNSKDGDDSASSLDSVENSDYYEDGENNESDESKNSSSNITFIASKNIDKDSQVLEGRLSQSDSGTGIAASSASWSTNGDLRGLSASSCINATRSQTFLAPETETGTLMRLVSVNTSSKSTIVQVRMWSVESGSNLITPSTGSAFTVPAHSESYFDISAAAPNSKGLYIQVLSEQTPVASFIQVRKMQGLTVKGVDVIQPLQADSKSALIPGVIKSDNAKLYLWSKTTSKVNVSWVGESGSKTVNNLLLEGKKLQIVDLGKVPEKVSALKVEANNPVFSMVSINRSGESGQEDLAFAEPVHSQGYSALVTPVKSEETTLYFASADSSESTVHLRVFDDKGALIARKTLVVPADSSIELEAKDFGDKAVVFEADSKSKVSFAARIHKKEVDDAHLAGIAWLRSQSLEPQQVSIKVTETQRVVK